MQRWENAYSGRTPHATGYLASLVSIIESLDSVDENGRLLAAILLKNGIPKAFSVPLPDEASDTSEERSLRQERAHVRGRLPVLLFGEANATRALHLQLALSNVALFDFPRDWPTLLEDLVGVASSAERPGAARVRAVKTLRLCLQSIRHRKIVVNKGPAKRGPRGNSAMVHMRDLGSLIGKAVHERKEVHKRASTIFGALAEGIVGHAQAAIVGGGGGIDESSDAYLAWQAECLLATGFTKCMTEMLPMVEIEDVRGDPRSPAVRELMGSLAQICEAVKAYPAPSVPPSLVGVPSILEEYTMRTDKIYRAALVCCISSIRALPQVFAPQVSRILPTVVEPILMSDTAALQSMPVKRLMNMTGLVRTVLMCAVYDEKRKGAMSKNAVLSVLMGGRGGDSSSKDGSNNPQDDPGVIEARATVTALLAEGTVERLVEALVGKLLRLHTEELREWEDDPEGRYETDLAEGALLDTDGISPRHCGGALLTTLIGRETDRVARTLCVMFQQLPSEDVNGMLNREACCKCCPASLFP